jgi:serine protease inhibitor
MRRLISLAAVATLLATACGTEQDLGAADPPPGDMDPVMHLTPQEARNLGEAINGFGFELFAGLDGATDDNVLTSPLSVSVLVGMLLAGAGGDTYQAIAETIGLDEADLDETAYAALLRALGEGDEDVVLQVANSLWSTNAFNDSFLDLTRQVFEAVAEQVDLGSQDAVQRIDEWVVEHTEGLIDGIAEDLGLPNPQVVAVLLNAVYFFGPWTTPFDPDLTLTGPFTRPDGSQVEAQLMSRRGDLAYHEADGYEVLRLPYGDDERFGMEIFLPEAGSSLPELMEDLDARAWRSATESLEPSDLMVLLPRFDLTYESSLDEALQALGMGPAYDSGADFSPMTPAGAWLSTVVHKARVKVDEEGTEAAAVTGGAMIVSAPPTFEANRPFLFTISDRETGTILFLGAVTDPTA